MGIVSNAMGNKTKTQCIVKFDISFSRIKYAWSVLMRITAVVDVGSILSLSDHICNKIDNRCNVGGIDPL